MSKYQVGEARPGARLTEDNVRAIRDVAARPNRPTNREIAAQYGVSHVTIWKIVTRRGWKHI